MGMNAAPHNELIHVSYGMFPLESVSFLLYLYVHIMQNILPGYNCILREERHFSLVHPSYLVKI